MRSRLTATEILRKKQARLLDAWRKSIRDSGGRTFELMTVDQFNEQARSLVVEFATAISSENYEDITRPEYEKLLTMLRGVSASRAERGFTPSETASFIMSFKEAINIRLQEDIKDPKKLATEVLIMGSLIDKLALYTFETFVASRERIIKEQVMVLEFSNPMIMVWDSVIAFPLQGILDTPRMAKLTTDLLNAIPRHQARVVIIDLTAIPTMDTATCNRLIQAIEAVRLMGSEAIITGISPSVASIIVKLGVDLKAATLRELREGIEYAFRALKLKVVEEVS
jgi:rsbT co-antagonist protein RsbR